MAMERIAVGGARAERDRARRTKRKDGTLTTTFPAIAGSEGSAGAEPATATTAGLTASFQSGHGDGRTEDCLPESGSVVPCNIMQ
jgi:hypothetical protein